MRIYIKIPDVVGLNLIEYEMDLKLISANPLVFEVIRTSDNKPSDSTEYTDYDPNSQSVSVTRIESTDENGNFSIYKGPQLI